MSEVSLNFLAGNLLDAPSVQGLVLIDHAEGTVGTMLPSAYQNLNLAEVRACCDQLFQLVRQNGNEAEELVLEYDDATLFLRTTADCTLCVLAEADGELPGLRVAAKLMLRQVTAQHLRELRASAHGPEVPQGSGAVMSVGGRPSSVSSGAGEAAKPRKPPPPSLGRVSTQPSEPPVRGPAAPPPAAAPQEAAKPQKRTKKRKPAPSSGGIWG